MSEVKERILELLKQLEEIYQDVELNGEIIAKGKRDCEARWNLIKDHITRHETILDIGSSLGYFSKKIAQTYPDSLVISFESDPIMCQIQAEMFKAEGIYNVVVCNHRLGKEGIDKWVRCVEFFDTVLLLSVLHHLPANEVVSFYSGLTAMSDELLLELPNPKEAKACGQDTFPELEKIRDIEGIWLGDIPSHLEDLKREVVLHEGFPRRGNLNAFFGVSHPDRHKFEIKDGKLNGKNIIKGVNVWNLLHFNIVWPLPNWWITQAINAYGCLDWKSDVRPWNLLRTATSLVAIDFITKFPEGDQAEYTDEDDLKLIELFTKMKPIKWEDL